MVDAVNKLIPVHQMWDGFWIEDFEHNTLTVSCSFDALLYKNFEVVFKEVIFFKLPESWLDTNIPGDALLHPCSTASFNETYPNFDTKGLSIFAIPLKIVLPISKQVMLYTFHVVAASVKAQKCMEGYNRPTKYYNDPFKLEKFPCFKNRVL
ncbi:MAG: hypothetical protein ACOYKE_04940 [Ferruginibacter sp.]